MRLLHVSHQYYPAIGGANATSPTSEELAARGTVDAFTTRSQDTSPDQHAAPARR